MWVSSQDKTILKKVNDIRLEIINVDTNGMKTKQYLIVWDGWQCFNERCLGEYSTKEKALKVLDMMQKQLTQVNGVIKTNYFLDKKGIEKLKQRLASQPIILDNSFTHLPTPIVFQMPSDEEV